MLLAALLMLCPLPQIGDTARSATETPVVVSSPAAKDSAHSDKLPSAPEPKVKSDAEIADTANSGAAATNAAASSPETAAPAEPIQPGKSSILLNPVRAPFSRTYEPPRQRKLWYGLAFAGHGAAVFDAWSTRRAISGGYGTEANPLLRPFANSGALYAATQVSPLVMDYLGRRMMTSQHTWVRRIWWLPQAAGASVSVSAGIHNVGLVH